MQSFRRVLEALDQPALLVGGDLRVAYANAHAHALLGYPEGDLRGMPMEALLGPHRHGELRNFEELLRGGASRRVRSVLRHDRGTSSQVSLTLTPCVVDGAVVAVSVRIESASAASAFASATARSSRPPGARPPSPAPSEPSIPRPSRPPLSQGERRMRETLPEGLPPARGGSLPTVPPERPWHQSEERLSRLRSKPAPSDQLASELQSKLRSMRDRCGWLQQRLERLGDDEALDKAGRAELTRITSELRALVDRSLELTRELRGLPTRDASG